jgi:hypothetical protein
MAVTVLAAPIDDLWHRLFGIDVTLWSPPHLMGILGVVINGWACLIIAREVFADRPRSRRAAMIVTGAGLYGSLHLTVDPTFRLAYLYGGVSFYSFAILGSLVLPFALLPTARVSGSRWAPMAALVLVALVGMAGHRIARVGFEVMQPVSVIEEEIAKDPTSPIAVANITARRNGFPAGRVGGLPLLIMGFVPVLALSLVDARRRPEVATIAYGLLLFVVGGWRIAGLPSLAPMTPTLGPTMMAFVLTAVAALVGGWAASRLADSL